MAAPGLVRKAADERAWLILIASQLKLVLTGQKVSVLLMQYVM